MKQDHMTGFIDELMEFHEEQPGTKEYAKEALDVLSFGFRYCFKDMELTKAEYEVMAYLTVTNLPLRRNPRLIIDIKNVFEEWALDKYQRHGTEYTLREILWAHTSISKDADMSDINFSL